MRTVAPSRRRSDRRRCRAPSFELQIPEIAVLLIRGIAVVVTDYQGMGTDAVHTHLQPVPEAHAVLDAARAAVRMGIVEPTAPVGV
ncbi:lipase family protein [Nocardia gamkensis]|uniref:lipase family protein n=1 Tax=Nocardia gamkensis TaxID=352869 RepID=UPI0036F0D0E2